MKSLGDIVEYFEILNIYKEQENPDEPDESLSRYEVDEDDKARLVADYLNQRIKLTVSVRLTHLSWFLNYK